MKFGKAYSWTNFVEESSDFYKIVARLARPVHKIVNHTFQPCTQEGWRHWQIIKSLLIGDELIEIDN